MRGALPNQHLVGSPPVLPSNPLHGPRSEHSFWCSRHAPKAQSFSLLGPLVIYMARSPNSTTEAPQRLHATRSHGVQPSSPTWYRLWRHAACRTSHGENWVVYESRARDAASFNGMRVTQTTKLAQRNTSRSCASAGGVRAAGKAAVNLRVLQSKTVGETTV